MDGERDRRSLFPVRAAIFLLGVAGIISQAVLLRELLVQYHGNEFSVGVIIGNWVAASALGAFLAGRRPRQTSPATDFVGLTALSSLLFPLAVSVCRTFKPLVGIQPGMGLTFVQIFSSSLLLLLLPAALQGGLFVVATRLYAHRCGDPQAAPGRSYALDAGGTMVGGLLCSVLLLPHLTPFGCAALLLFCNGGITLWLMVSGGDAPRVPLLPLAMLLASLLLAAGGSAWLEGVTRARQWQGREVVSSRNSPYQNISVIRDSGQLTVYTDGLPFTTLPDADIASVEELAHIPALAHPRPRTVLLLGGGSGGLPAELLKHPSVERIDCLELDPALLETVTSLGNAAGAPAGGERITLRFLDARRYLAREGEGYDLILLNLPLPLSLQANRHFSREFLALVRSRLRPGGVLALAAPGSTAYYSPEHKELTAILLATIADVFPRVEVVPGDGNLFLASVHPGDPVAAPLLSRRLQERGIRAALITPEHLSWRLDPSQSRWFSATMAGASSRPNRDFDPLLLTAGLARSTGMQNPWLKPLLTGAGEMGAVGLAATVSLTILLAFLVGGRRSGIAIPCLVASSGMTAMLLELVLMFAFQICNGVMFQAIALLIALFMGGLWAGSLFATARPRGDLRLLQAGEGGLLLLSLALFGLFTGGRTGEVPPVAVTVMIMPLLLATGFCAGMEFPPAVRLAGGNRGDAAEGVGTVYAADLLGGWVGGLFGALLLPFLGVAGCCALLVGLKLAGMVLLHRQGKMCKM